MMSSKLLSVFAPAKINLYLHVTGRRDDGYHFLDSLVAFADVGDHVSVAPAQDFQFEITGPFAGHFKDKERDASPSSANLVVQAAWALSRAAQKAPALRAVLHKVLPMGAGLGGGSSDAAAMIWALCELWGLPRDADYLPELMTRLGADVPVCFPCQSARVRGVGDVLDPVPDIPEVPIVLAYPGKPCMTADVFMRYSGEFSEPRSVPRDFGGYGGLIGFLGDNTRNDLFTAACEDVPEIGNVIHALEVQKGCGLARMTGSGSSCFGLFADEAAAQAAVVEIAKENPDWWVESGWLGRPERY